MKLQFKSLCFGFVIVSLIIQVENAEDIDVVNDHCEILFRVFEDNRIRVHNLHRAKKPSMKFSLHGTTVEKVNKQNSSFWILTLGDKSAVDFVVEEKGPNVTEFYLLWHGGGPNAEREVCFYVGYNHANWYNGYQSINCSWPMNLKKTIPKQQFNFLFDTHRFDNYSPVKEHILILEHFYLNSDGFAIMLDQHAPWFIRSATNGDDSILCFSTDNAKPFKIDEPDNTYLDLKIRLFTSSNIRSVTDYVVHQSTYVPKPKIMADENMIKYPTWFTFELWIQVKDTVMPFSSTLESYGFDTKYRIILYFWDTTSIESMIKYDVYPDDDMISRLKNKGIEIGVQFLDLKFNSEHELSKQFCIKSTWFIDFSMPGACKLFASQLAHLQNQKQLEVFLFTSNTIIESFYFNDTFVQKYPSLLTTRFIETVNKVGNTIISEYAFKTQHLPVWVRLTNYWLTSFDQLLLEIIPSVLSVSIAGYSFVVPYTVGGMGHTTSPTEEQFIRMLQAITFMPAVSIGKRPWMYSNKAVVITKKYLQLHSEHANTIIELAKKRIADGSPIIRPMWYIAPDDPKTFSIGDQYMLGDDILVAPVVRVGQTERTVYLTTGTWIDQHGKSYQGPGEFKVPAPLEELPYFKRKIRV